MIDNFPYPQPVEAIRHGKDFREIDEDEKFGILTFCVGRKGKVGKQVQVELRLAIWGAGTPDFRRLAPAFQQGSIGQCAGDAVEVGTDGSWQDDHLATPLKIWRNGRDSNPR